MTMQSSIIIVHHDAPQYLKSCLRSVEKAGAGLSHETIVVDNASRSPDALKKEFPQIIWLQNKTNVGWGAAVNQGAARSRGEILVFLNPDTELLPDSLRRLNAFFAGDTTKSLGPIGGKLLFSNGETQPSCGPFPRLGGLLWRRLLPATKRKYYLRLPEGGAGPVEWVTGAFMAVQRAVFQELGGFDEGFFLYYEDADFCLRARQKGYPAYYLPGAVAYHHQPLAVRVGPDRALKRVIQSSRTRYFGKHRPGWESWALKQLQRLERAVD